MASLRRTLLCHLKPGFEGHDFSFPDEDVADDFLEPSYSPTAQQQHTAYNMLDHDN